MVKGEKKWWEMEEVVAGGEGSGEVVSFLGRYSSLKRLLRIFRPSQDENCKILGPLNS